MVYKDILYIINRILWKNKTSKSITQYKTIFFLHESDVVAIKNGCRLAFNFRRERRSDTIWKFILKYKGMVITRHKLSKNYTL